MNTDRTRLPSPLSLLMTGPIPTMIAPGMGIISAANNWDAGYFKINNTGDDQPGVPDEENPK